MLAGLREGASAIVDIDRELGRLTAALREKSTLADLAADRERFLSTFRNMYLAAPFAGVATDH